MARIAGVDLPLNKRVEVGLTYIFGIGRTRASNICGQAGVNKDIRVKDLSEDDVRKIRQIITDEGKVEGDLRKDVGLDINCRCAASGRTPMRVRARARARARLPARRKPPRSKLAARASQLSIHESAGGRACELIADI
jgi:small subunit ribosomal protein S13